MKLPLSIAQKLLLLQQGSTIPAAAFKHIVVDKLTEDGIVIKQRIGSNKNVYHLSKTANLEAYLFNHFGIANLENFIDGLADEALTRATAIDISSNSKLKPVRTFKGFLVNCFDEMETTLNGSSFRLKPNAGTFQFIYDFEQFIPAQKVIIVGIENPENFRWIERQRHLFEGLKPLFISRYPQSQHGDVIGWLNAIPNQYLHFGDFDFEGINLYLREYKKHLRNKAKYFIPNGIETVLANKGNRALYDAQLHHQPDEKAIDEPEILSLIQLFYSHKKVLEQEALIDIRRR